MSQYPLTVAAGQILHVVLRHVTTYIVLLFEYLYSLVQGLLRDAIGRPHFFLVFFFTWLRFFLISFFLQQLASLSLVELCKAASGEDGCTTVSTAEISVLLNSLESPAASLRFATLQGLLVLTDILSAGDHGTAQTAQLVRRLWVAKFDVDDENAKLGEK